MSVNARTDRDRILNLYLVNREKLFDVHVHTGNYLYVEAGYNNKKYK